jgi:hypothetical protein
MMAIKGTCTAIKKVYTPEQIVGTVREADILLGQRSIDSGHQTSIRDRFPKLPWSIAICK